VGRGRGFFSASRRRADVSLEVPPPRHPELEAIDPNEYDDAEVMGENYRRDDIEALLADGAWEEAFREWSQGASLDAEDWAIVEDLDMTDQFDFFWDDFADRVGYHAPGIPEDWKEREYHPAIQSWEQVSGINAALTELGQTVCEVLKQEYIDWEADYEEPDDLPDF